MVKIIGRKGCTNCLIAKKQLMRAKVEFEYLDLDTLENKDDCIAKAKKNGISTLPFILKDDKFVDLKSIISNTR